MIGYKIIFCNIRFGMIITNKKKVSEIDTCTSDKIIYLNNY